jgi:hypothetical protein
MSFGTSNDIPFPAKPYVTIGINLASINC